MRTFVSINLSDITKKEIYMIQNEIKSNLDEKTVNSIKWEEKDKFHITLFFIGDVTDNQLKMVSEELGKINQDKSFQTMHFKSKSFNAFPNLRNPRVLIIELENPDEQVLKLYEEVNAALSNCGFQPDKKFHTHITLGRVRRDRKVLLNNIEQKIIPDFEFDVNGFYFMESKLDSFGSKYKVIKKFEL